ncbi:MAG TPA: efflux transporter outer membrane subunit [Caulobacteraceae bacterium]|nr:efflux transporter outer membrane subunit [Caulobacteraceae bacterium]
MTPTFAKLSAMLVASAALAGCVVGPDYKGPPHPAPLAERAPAFHRADLASVAPSAPPARWWTALNDPELDKLVDDALAGSPDVRAAEARLRQSRALFTEQQRNMLPSATANAGFLYANVPGNILPGSGGGTELKLYNAGFDATWEIDLFGGKQRAAESAADQAQAVQADLDDVRVSLAAEVARVYVELRDQQQRRAIAEQSVALESRMVDLAGQRNGQGVESSLDLERLRAQLETTRETLIPLQSDIEGSLDRLAVLTGREPGALDAELTPAGAVPDLPAQVAVGDPADLLRRRPDIRAAERKLAAQNAVIGQRTADLFPKVNLIGLLGWGSTDISRLFDGTTGLAAPVLQWNALDFGRTRARIDQAKAGRDEAEAQYESAVLNALGDVETGLARLGHARQDVIAQARVEASADRAAELMRQRQSAGVASTSDVIDTERTRLSAQQNLLIAKAALIEDFVALQKSLGLGWSAPEARS